MSVRPGGGTEDASAHLKRIGHLSRLSFSFSQQRTEAPALSTLLLYDVFALALKKSGHARPNGELPV